MKRSVAIIGAFVLVAIAGGSLFFQIYTWLHSPIEKLTEATVYEVPQGASLGAVLHDLQKREVIAHPQALSMWLRFTQPSKRIKAGEYELRPQMAPIDVVDLLCSGHVVLHSLTVVEGATFADFQRVLAANPAIRVSATNVGEPRLMQRLGANNAHPEGEFFPDTYRFPKGTSDLEIYGLAYRRMQTELERAWNERDPALPFASAYEALILASIVEKESALDSERPLIAGVFIERLRKGMRLQTDPTVIYGLGEAYDGNIRKADLLRDTPYNTYTRAGLPPTPICLPGLESLRATVHPQITGALYFVATGKDGGHHFSKTLEEHNSAVQRYLQSLHRK
jgi:UPF0755 protein